MPTSSLSYAAFAVDLTGRIVWNELCPGNSMLYVSWWMNLNYPPLSGLHTLGQAKVGLDNGGLSAGITRNGTFTMWAFESSSLCIIDQLIYCKSRCSYRHLCAICSSARLRVRTSEHFFLFAHEVISIARFKLRIDVQDEESNPVVRPYIPGTPLSPPSNVKLTYPISLSARAKYDYYVPKESFNLIGMFQNPMMMIMLFTGVMVLAMPYLMVRSGQQYNQPIFTREIPRKTWTQRCFRSSKSARLR